MRRDHCFLPSRAGVYLLAHRASGYLYAGSSVRLDLRRRRWVEAIASVDGPRPRQPYGRLPPQSPEGYGLSRRFLSALREVGSAGWSFDVVQWFPDLVSAGELWRAELHWINVVFRLAGRKRLNAGRVKPNYFSQFDGRFADGGPAYAARLRR